MSVRDTVSINEGTRKRARCPLLFFRCTFPQEHHVHTHSVIENLVGTMEFVKLKAIWNNCLINSEIQVALLKFII